VIVESMMCQSEAYRSILVVGLGNELLGDDGVGIHVLRELGKRCVPANVKLVEAGTAVDTLWDDLIAADRVIVVDAVETGGEPGAVYRYPYAECPESRAMSLSGHEVGLYEKLVQLELTGHELPEIVILGVEAERIELSTSLSPKLEARLPAVTDLVIDEISRLPAMTKVSEQTVCNTQGACNRET